MKVCKIIFIISSILILAMCYSQFMTNIPPVGVLVTILRLPYQFLSGWLLGISVITEVLLLLSWLTKKMQRTPVNFLILLIATVILCLNLVYLFRVGGAKAVYHNEDNTKYKKSEAATEQYSCRNESSEAGLMQLLVYLPESGKTDVCLIHVNYGGWSVQGADTGSYLEHLCEQQGYAFVQLAGIGREEGNLNEIQNSISDGIHTLQTKYHFQKTFLVGSSAGGHLALLTAFQGTTGTLGGETAKIQEAFLGTYREDSPLYYAAGVKNAVYSQQIPVLFIQGTKDSQLGLQDKEELYFRLEQKGIPYTVLNLPGTDHAFDMAFAEQSIAGRRSIREMKKWLSLQVQKDS